VEPALRVWITDFMTRLSTPHRDKTSKQLWKERTQTWR
jgi:hypothetical protein